MFGKWLWCEKCAEKWFVCCGGTVLLKGEIYLFWRRNQASRLMVMWKFGATVLLAS